MEFAILGPLQVREGGDVIPITAPRQRDLLVALLLRANQVVAVEWLIDQMWGETPPASARVTLHNHVRRLRRELRRSSPAAAQPLVTQSPGYVLQVLPDALDLNRFDALLAAAHRCPPDQPERRLELLDQAIGLWRGAPLADVHAPGLREIAPALEERRLSAIEERISILLDIGWYETAISQLRLLVAEHPWRERLRGQLMHALWAGGRPIDAQATYREFRHQLVADLGIEPSAALQDLHRRILASAPPDGPRPGASGARAAARKPAVPAEFPMGTATFTGRAEQIRLLNAELDRSGTDHVLLTVVHGPAGTGKSALAVHVAQQLTSRFPDGQLYVDLRGAAADQPPQRPLDVLNRWIGTLDPGTLPAFTDRYEAAAQFRSLVAGRRLLIMLDNAHDADQVRPLIPARPPAAVLITTRRPLGTLDNTTRIRIDRLDAAEAVQLLGRIVGEDRTTRAPAAAKQIVTSCGHLPLAIRAAAARLASRPDESLDDLAEQLADEQTRLDLLHQDDLDLRSCLRVSYEQLRGQPGGQPAAELLRQLATLESPDFGPEDVATLARVSLARAAHLLGQLCDAELAQRQPGGRCSLPALVRLFAQDL